jgi:hypothetical protein
LCPIRRGGDSLAASATRALCLIVPKSIQEPGAPSGVGECLLGYASKTIQNHLNFLHGIFAFAVRRRWVSSNPVALVDRPKKNRSPRRRIRYLQPSELDRLVLAVPNDELAPRPTAGPGLLRSRLPTCATSTKPGSCSSSMRSALTMHVIRQLWVSAARYLRLAASVRPAPEEFVAEHQEIVENLIANLRTTERLLAGTYESVPNRVD